MPRKRLTADNFRVNLKNVTASILLIIDVITIPLAIGYGVSMFIIILAWLLPSGTTEQVLLLLAVPVVVLGKNAFFKVNHQEMRWKTGVFRGIVLICIVAVSMGLSVLSSCISKYRVITVSSKMKQQLESKYSVDFTIGEARSCRIDKVGSASYVCADAFESDKPEVHLAIREDRNKNFRDTYDHRH